MYKLTFEKRVWIVKQVLKGVPRVRAGLAQGVSDRAVREIMCRYKEFGWDGLLDHKTGRPERCLHPKAVEKILTMRVERQHGACMIEKILNQEGFLISHRQIEKVLVRNNLVIPNVKKQRARNWVRYELPNPNDLWHTDWTHCPFTDKEFCAYIDDKTRMITSYGIFKNANTLNSLSLLKTGIATFGKPKGVMTDHGATYYANHPNAQQEHTSFRATLDKLGIKHCLARVNRPQTNGKIERFFGSYKVEYLTGKFSTIKDFIDYYNTKRLHMSLNYRTPQSLWDELTNRK